MSQKTPLISYPGELPDIGHQTISLRTQLRLNFETYSWIRYVSWTGFLLLGALLFLLPGGFPPQAFVLVIQTLPETGHLLALHGSAALFSLLALIIQALTWFLLWAFFLLTCHHFARYTWRLHRSETFLASGWQSSTTLGSEAFSTLSEPTARGRSSAVPAAQDQVHASTLAQTQPQNLIQPAFSPARPRPSTGNNEFAPGASQSQNGWSSLASGSPFPSPSSSASHSAPNNWPSLSAAGSTGVAWDVGITRRGRPNEDSILTLSGTCNFADRLLPFELHIVADGMGGHTHGGLASHLAIRGMLETVVPGLVACNVVESEQVVDILIDGVHWANQVIYQYGQEQGTDMGTTITAVLVLDETAYIINVGDSRTYVYRPGAGLTQITRDHSLVAHLVETGAIAPDDVYTHPDRNKVYRGLGDKMDVTVDWFVLPVQAGDVLLLCSDGLWEMVRDPRIADILQMYATAPSLASHALLRAALQAGGTDNVSLLVARV